MSTRAKPQNSTHTHTHTHTDSFLKSLKQIGTICFAFSFLIFPNFASAENIPTTNPGCTTTVLGAQNIANGSAALEPDFSANTINTTWYSNGEQLTGNNIPGTCRYDAALTPPTPSPRPGYVFGGWKVKTACSLAGLDASIVGTIDSSISYSSYDNLSGSGDDWAATFSYGEIRGVSLRAINNDSTAERSVGIPGEQVSGDSGACWCRITKYTPDGGTQCLFENTPWVLVHDNPGLGDCSTYCARQTSGFEPCDVGHPDHDLVAMFGGCDTEPDHSLDIAFRRALFGQTQ